MDTQHPDLHPLFADHLRTLQARADKALLRGGFDHLVVAAGRPANQFLDDRPYPFAVNPHFKHWLPATKAPDSWIVHTPGRKPKLIYLQPHDYWHVVPDSPAGYWVEHFDIAIIREADEARALLPGDAARCAILGEANAALDGFAPNNPPDVLNYLHYQRSYKTPYELAMMRVASKIGARAHRAAERRVPRRRFGIRHQHRLHGSGAADRQRPAVRQHHRPERARGGAALHGSGARAAGAGALVPDRRRRQLPRLRLRHHAHVRGRLRRRVPRAGRRGRRRAAGLVCPRAREQSYPELHLHAHRVLGDILKEHGFIRMSGESALEAGITSTFFPHGLGHPIGLQVHDVAGFQASDSGGTLRARPAIRTCA